MYIKCLFLFRFVKNGKNNPTQKINYMEKGKKIREKNIKFSSSKIIYFVKIVLFITSLTPISNVFCTTKKNNRNSVKAIRTYYLCGRAL